MTTELQLLKSEKFGEVQADIYSDSNEMFMTINQLSECLGYASTAGLGNIISRNEYLSTDEFSTTHKMCVVEGNRTITREIKLFNEQGIYEVAFLSKTEVARKFRSWVRGILTALRKGELQLVNSNISLAPQIIDYKMQQILNYSEQMMLENRELKSDVAFIKSQLLKITPAPKYTDWKKDINEKIKSIAEASRTTHKVCLHQMYLGLKENGYDLNTMKKQYCGENGLVNCSTLDFIESSDEIRNEFESLVNSMLLQNTPNAVVKSSVIQTNYNWDQWIPIKSGSRCGRSEPTEQTKRELDPATRTLPTYYLEDVWNQKYVLL